MTARSPSLPLSEHEDFSSPDPLVSSQNDEDCQHETRSPSPTKRPFSSPTKRQRVDASTTPPRTSHSQWINAASPSKTVTEQTLSPWKIRITVETEPDELNTNAGMLSSRTTMVPLRDASSPNVSRPRKTRGRGSQPSTAKSKRSATPVRKNGPNRSRRHNVTDLDITVLGDDGDSDNWNRPRSPRKRNSTLSKKSQAVLEQTDIAETQQSIQAGPKRQTRRSTKDIQIREDTDAEEDRLVNVAMESDSPELRSIDLNRVSVRTRSMLSKQRPASFASQDTDFNKEAAEDINAFVNGQSKDVSVLSVTYPTPDPSVQDDREVYEPFASLPDDHNAGFDTILESEGFTMIDLESIPSARHLFSSPTEAQAATQTPEAPATLRKDAEPNMQPMKQVIPHSIPFMKHTPRAIPSYFTEGESDISSNVPSSPPLLSQLQRSAQPSSVEIRPRDITPHLHSSPKLPSPPRAIHPLKDTDNTLLRKSNTPTLAKVVKAGIALQGVLSPKSIKTTPRIPGGTPKERLDSLFEGFDSGTQRELRAGLRFGEELAKQQRSSSDIAKSSRIDGRPERDGATQVWRGEALVHRTPFQVAVQSKGDEMIEINTGKQSVGTSRLLPRKRSSLCQQTLFTSSKSPPLSTDNTSQSILESQKCREVQWQREREAVSKEIENASRNQVVVIDSDNEHQNFVDLNSHTPAEEDKQGDQDDFDIWCEEAVSCDQRSANAGVKQIRACKKGKLPTVKMQELQHRTHVPMNKLRGSNSPSTQRRDYKGQDESSYLTNGDMTGLFHHDPKSKIRFGAAEIDRQKQQLKSGSFDIDRMANIPRRPLTEEARAHDNPETDDSDVLQVQIELDFNQNEVEQKADISQALSHEKFSEPSMTEDAEVGNVETVADFTEVESSISLPSQTIKIPVNFNDSTASNIAPYLLRSSPSTATESSRPNTPRSALKGARRSLGLEDVNAPAVRKVVFSAREIHVDLDGQEEEASMQSVSSSPEIELSRDIGEQNPHSACSLTENSPTEKTGLLGWLFGGGRKSNSDTSPSRDGANDKEPSWENVQSSSTAAPSWSRDTAVRNRVPSYLLPPSYPSDPKRDTKRPLATSGNFTDTHFRTLHIIYAKSLRPRFHAPQGGEVRPALRKLLNAAFEANESACGLGIFEWKVDETALRVLERFMREIEWGYPARSEVIWEWSEMEVCERLFRIVVGEEVRKEEKAALESAAR